MKHASFILSFILLLALCSKANNIQVGNVSTTVAGGNVIIEFDLSWENSWRTAGTNNYDGAWIFMKFKDNDGKWKHLHFTGNNITIPPGFIFNVSNNAGITGIGAFIHRAALGAGNITLTNIRAGVESLPGIYDVKIFAVEMVYIPQGSFYVGDGNGIAGDGFQSGPTTDPYLVGGNGNTITVGSAFGQLNGFLQGVVATPNLAGFPSGYSHYWMMKYELSQGGYRDFLNTLTYEQQDNHFAPGSIHPNSAIGTLISGPAPDATNNTMRGRLEIAVQGSAVNPITPAVIGCDNDDDNIFDEPNDKEWSAMTFLGWKQVAAYLDWAGLRPMTELEYEKACRGPLTPVINEYAWGNALLANYLYTLINDGQTNEFVSNMSSLEGNAIVSITAFGTVKNVRGGIFATPFSTRMSSGAGYYGVMELTGNASEYAVTVRNEAGRSYTGKLGNGKLDQAGYADENFWPGINGNTSDFTANTTYGSVGVTASAGIFLRGGSFANSTFACQVSFRSPAVGDFTFKTASSGIRGVRDAN